MMEPMYYTYLSSPVGDFLIAGTANALKFTSFTSGHQQRTPKADWNHDAGPLSAAVSQLTRYFDGEAIDFDLPLAPEGTEFQCTVWESLRTIPYGSTRSYGEIAKQLGNPGASRAIGAANAANHLPIVIPCHRVIGADKTLTGFGGGLDAKAKLLTLEGVRIDIAAEQLSLL